MKYLFLERGDGLRVPVLFPDCLEHAEVANGMRSTGQSVWRPVDAGFVTIKVGVEDDRRAHCHGQSVSLNLPVDKEARTEAEWATAKMVTP